MSVLWELTPDLKIIPEKTWMGRALIRTAHALTYYQAQRMLDGKAADVDGAHIRCLLLTLFQRYMKPLVDSGRVFAAVPPLHRIETMAAGKKSGEVIYTYSDDEMRKTIAALEKSGQKIKQPIQRYKGLGEMDAKQLRETTMNRETRTLRRINVKDAEEASEVFDLLMGSDVAPRKEFIVHGADELDKSRIDA